MFKKKRYINSYAPRVDYRAVAVLAVGSMAAIGGLIAIMWLLFAFAPAAATIVVYGLMAFTIVAVIVVLFGGLGGSR